MKTLKELTATPYSEDHSTQKHQLATFSGSRPDSPAARPPPELLGSMEVRSGLRAVECCSKRLGI